MRLMRRYLKPIHLFEMQAPNEDSPDFYPGQQPEWTYTRTVRGNVQPAENKLTAEMYGERVHDMLSVILPLGSGICEGVRISFSGTQKADYKAVSVKEYNTHTVILAEKVH